MPRLDILLVDKGYFPSRSKASVAIRSGFVLVNDLAVLIPSASVQEADHIRVSVREQFVSRGGDKLYRLLLETGYEPAGKTVLDVGSSTGGFSDCLLQCGAMRVVAIDVGTGQIHPSLIQNPRLELHEKTDVRNFIPNQLFELITVDVSFISVLKILPYLEKMVLPDGDVMILFKPQFEQKERRKVKGGVLKKADAERTLNQFISELAAMGWQVLHLCKVEQTGRNYESMLRLRKKPGEHEVA